MCNGLRLPFPSGMGGLGLRRVISLALPSYITSAVSSAVLQDALLSHCACLPDSFLSSYSLEWSNLFGTTPVGDLARKQSSWDRPGISLDISQVWAGLHSSREKAVFLAASAQHSGSWLAALPISSCGLRLDNEAVRVAVALIRLGLHVCVPHECRCGSSVDAWGSHAFVCKRAMARSTRHHAINDIVARSIISSGVPVSKEPAGMISGSLKRLDGVTLIPWKGERLYHGMPQLRQPWLTLIWRILLPILGSSPSRQLQRRSPSTLTSPGNSYSNQLRLRTWGLPVLPRRSYFQSWVDVLASCRVIRGKNFI